MDITSMSPVTGRLVKEDGSTFNVADASEKPELKQKIVQMAQKVQNMK